VSLQDQNARVIQGKAQSLDFTLTDTDGTTPLHLTGSTLTWRMSRNPGEAALVEKTGIAGDDTGATAVDLAAVDLADKSGYYCHSLSSIDGDSNEIVLAEGTLQVFPAVGEPS
jgi:hypothetical protein